MYFRSYPKCILSKKIYIYKAKIKWMVFSFGTICCFHPCQQFFLFLLNGGQGITAFLYCPLLSICCFHPCQQFFLFLLNGGQGITAFLYCPLLSKFVRTSTFEKIIILKELLWKLSINVYPNKKLNMFLHNSDWYFSGEVYMYQVVS